MKNETKAVLERVKWSLKNKSGSFCGAGEESFFFRCHPFWINNDTKMMNEKCKAWLEAKGLFGNWPLFSLQFTRHILLYQISRSRQFKRFTMDFPYIIHVLSYFTNLIFNKYLNWQKLGQVQWNNFLLIVTNINLYYLEYFLKLF